MIDLVANGSIHSDAGNYLVRRIGGLDKVILRSILWSAFGNARVATKETRVDEQIGIVTAKLAELEADEEDADEARWRDLATHAGVSPFLLASIARMLPAEETLTSWSFMDLMQFQFEVLTNGPGMLFGLADPGSSDLARILPRATIAVGRRKEFVESVDAWESRWQKAIQNVLPLWICGRPLNRIGAILKAHRGSGNIKPISLDHPVGRNALRREAAVSILCHHLRQIPGPSAAL